MSEHKREEEVVLENELCIVDPVTKKSFLTISTIKSFDTMKKKVIGNVPRASMLLQQLPVALSIAQSEMMSGAYKVVFAEGAVGTMMKYKNGMLGTPLVGENGRVTAHSGLVPLEDISLTPLMVFSVMSAITGQYFMARIDESLGLIARDVKNIIELIYDEKESDSFTAYNFYEYVRKNIEMILGNEALKIATLTNIQANNNNMNSNISFYSKSINREVERLNDITSDSKLTAKRVSKLGENKIASLMKQQHLCFELFCIGKVYEMQVAEMYDKSYCENLISELKILGDLIDEDINKIIGKSEEVSLQIIRESTVKGKDAVSQYKKIDRAYKNKQSEFEKNKQIFINNVCLFNIENQKAKEFIIIDNLVYM